MFYDFVDCVRILKSDGLTPKQLAFLIGVSDATVNSWASKRDTANAASTRLVNVLLLLRGECPPLYWYFVNAVKRARPAGKPGLRKGAVLPPRPRKGRLGF